MTTAPPSPPPRRVFSMDAQLAIEQGHHARWERWFGRLWPGCHTAPPADYATTLGCDLQRAGVDRLIRLPLGTATPTGLRGWVAVDEKVERYDQRLFIEYWSVFHAPKDPRNALGWAYKESRCDYYAWAREPSRDACLLPAALLRQVARAHMHAWMDAGKARRDGFIYAVIQQQGGHTSRGVAVPWSALHRAMQAQGFRITRSRW